jgi:hypothetical protein
MARFITQSELARRVKLSRGRISQLVKEGVIRVTDGRVNSVESQKILRDRIDRRRANLKLASQILSINRDVKEDLAILRIIIDELTLIPIERGILIEKVRRIAQSSRETIEKMIEAAIYAGFVAAKGE